MLASSTTSLLLPLLLGGGQFCSALPPLNPAPAVNSVRRPLTGRFLHITGIPTLYCLQVLLSPFSHSTDIHPDPFYKFGSATDAQGACHHGSGPAGYYGAETSDCDAPITLVNATFDWIRDNIRDDIDFILWTGDSVRHDNDEKIPRHEDQVLEQNELIADKFREVFGRDDDDDSDPTNDFVIPIVPNFGNNDILPHNIFTPGPNRWTSKYLDIWKSFIPEEQRHQFQRGGWFSVEAIPNKLSVLSLNTLFFFSKNAGVDGCAMKSEPGYEHFEWLRVQLQILRERGMKAILIGHVPPARTENKQLWDETCWQKYTLWTRQYRDVIVSSMFGHMNIDHFLLQDFESLADSTLKGKMPGSMKAKILESEDKEFSATGASDYLVDLRKAWATLPSPKHHDNAVEKKFSVAEEIQDFIGWKKGKKGHGDNENYLDDIGGVWGERYSISQVGASVVPNFFPTLRIFEYNTTGLENQAYTHAIDRRVPVDRQLEEAVEDLENYDKDEGSGVDTTKKKKKKDKKHHSKKYKFTVPDSPSKSSPPGPAYSPQTLTLLGYTQYFANLTHINNDYANESVHEFGHYRQFENASAYDDAEFDAQKWRHGKHHGKNKPKHPDQHLNEFKYEVEYQTLNDSDPFKLKDLTVRSYIDLARRIGDFKKSKTSKNALGWASGDVDEFEAMEMTNRDREVEEVDYSLDDEDMEVEEVDYSNDGLGQDGESEENEFEVEKKKMHKKKKHHKGPKNHVWYTFVKRAFVGTMDLEDIHSEFGVMDVSEAMDDNPAMIQSEPSLPVEDAESELLGDGEL
ncbi:uncharacterized protein K452DRAFT_305533 [Aplosporella prunicola CBS 121167]|uniref:Endopolyphosphatase n=1 Tax=Aplosporella prunicola CBS 121167 TaxID=1176127 RepID=A0A6A6BN29_9PEZI|nr:uncharacterized protein K452DRAFT_305533 [Aplosporella prunicola CBS 121167]KAF2145530.1 hypothetical protein K452DRAFT_305533 [Aplosporella prunicola CBS 121167]